ncbi:hypothetical protein [Streptomyces sioyaensis]|uniref:hypothetical protein n=1 Tax=Streptomyces sioyaensis TaxID=67364 RepID=UPI003F541B6F
MKNSTGHDIADALGLVLRRSAIVRAHQHAAGAGKTGPRPEYRPTMPSAGPAAG